MKEKTKDVIGISLQLYLAVLGETFKNQHTESIYLSLEVYILLLTCAGEKRKKYFKLLYVNV